MAKSKMFWLTLDKQGTAYSSAYILVWPYKAFPQKDRDAVYHAKETISWEIKLCPSSFKNVTGITLAPGQRIKARLVIKE